MNTWVAPDHACSVTITAEGTNGTGTATIEFTVVEPAGLRVLRGPDSLVRHTKDHPDIGIMGVWYVYPSGVSPSSVSFHAVLMWEEECEADDTGVYELFPDKGHNPEDAIMCGETVTDAGTYAGPDYLYSGDPVMVIDPPPEPPYVGGHRDWPIVSKYKLTGKTEHLLDSISQVATLADDHVSLSITKDQASGSCLVGDDTEDYY